MSAPCRALLSALALQAGVWGGVPDSRAEDTAADEGWWQCLECRFCHMAEEKFCPWCHDCVICDVPAAASATSTSASCIAGDMAESQVDPPGDLLEHQQAEEGDQRPEMLVEHECADPVDAPPWFGDFTFFSNIISLHEAIPDRQGEDRLSGLVIVNAFVNTVSSVIGSRATYHFYVVSDSTGVLYIKDYQRLKLFSSGDHICVLGEVMSDGTLTYISASGLELATPGSMRGYS